MSQEEQQIQQRHLNFEALRALGVDQYPHSFSRTHNVDALVREFGDRSGEQLDAEPTTVTTAGRILGIRAFGKANFLVLSDGLATIQVYVRADALSERDFKIYKLLDFGDQVGVAGRMFRTLFEAGINIELITTSEIRITCLIEEAQVKDAAQALHRAFRLEGS